MYQLDDEALLDEVDAAHARTCEDQRELLRLLAEVDRRALWQDCSAADMAHWVCMRYGISYWKAERWIQAAHALGGLPRIEQAFARGEVGIDKVVELARFATPETEERLLAWAEEVSSGAIRRKGDLALRERADDAEADRTRSLRWWTFDEGRRLGLQAELPSAEGAVVVAALERVAASLPVMPDEDDPYYVDARRADALVALASARLGEDADADRATVVVHAPLEALASSHGGCEVEGGGVIHASTARRLACSGRVQVVVEDPAGDPVHLGRVVREPPAWMLRQLRYRDGECRFPGCGARRFTHAHHIVWWQRGGRTDLDNLVLVCSLHHRLVHEHGWGITRQPDGTVAWTRPDGTRYRAGPGPPRERVA